MAGQRYELIREEWWPYLSPAIRGIDADLRALESTTSGGGNDAGTLPTSFYTGDEAA